jgi:hypothetical protein
MSERGAGVDEDLVGRVLAVADVFGREEAADGVGRASRVRDDEAGADLRWVRRDTCKQGANQLIGRRRFACGSINRVRGGEAFFEDGSDASAPESLLAVLSSFRPFRFRSNERNCKPAHGIFRNDCGDHCGH